MTTEPTDAELWQLHMQQPGQHKDPIDFARAVLAKWGSPVVAGEPCHHRLVDGRNQVVKSGYMCMDCGALFAAGDHITPQPTQAQAGAVPLTDEQCDAIYDALDLFGRGVDVYEFGLPMSAGDGETPAKEVARGLIREAAHGIAPPPTA